MSKKTSIIIICIIVFVIALSLVLSIFVSNRDKIKNSEDKSINYKIIEENGKFGVIDANEEIVIDIKYDEIVIPNKHKEVFYCISGEEKSFINLSGKELFKKYENVELIEIENVYSYEKNTLKFSNEGKYGLINLNGDIIVEAEYDEITSLGYKQGEFLIKKNNKYGLVDDNGNIKIKLGYLKIVSDQYFSATDDYNKSGYIVCIVTTDGYRYGYFDYEGNKVLSEEYNNITRINYENSNNIYLIASKKGQYGVFLNGSKIINTQYQSIQYSEDLNMFIVEKTGQFGVYNSNGISVLETEFDNIEIRGMYIYTEKNNEKKVYDSTGIEVNIPYNVTIEKTNSEFYIKEENSEYSLIDSNFNEISNTKYNNLNYAFDKYFIATNENGKQGIINNEENTEIEFKYDVIQTISTLKILQALSKDGSVDIYNNKLEVTVQMKDAIIEFIDGQIRVYNDETEYLLDNNGNIEK